MKTIRKYTKYDENGENETHYYANPLNKSSVRNMSCGCGSGKKYKKCCAVQSYLSKEELEELLTTHRYRKTQVNERKNNPISIVK